MFLEKVIVLQFHLTPMQSTKEKFKFGWPFTKNVALHLITPQQMYSKCVQPKNLTGQIVKLVGKWPMADCYFVLCYAIRKQLNISSPPSLG